MNHVKLLAKYPRVDLKQDELIFDVEKDWKVRPAWIKLINIDGSLPRFLSVQVPKFGELIYKSFGGYYFPFDYTNDEERRLMDGMAKDYDDMVGQKFNIPMAKALLDKVPVGEIPLESRILDLGCGTGIISDLIASHGYKHFTLVDFSSGMLEAAKTKSRLRGARFILADITKELPDGKYDLVVSVMLFNTFDAKTTESILEKLKYHLKPKAILAVVEDTDKPAYTKYFEVLFSGMVDVANRKKFVFVGKLK
jgi:ubiquinone/menaquinone biosynthesis C-methylase UbiE